MCSAALLCTAVNWVNINNSRKFHVSARRLLFYKKNRYVAKSEIVLFAVVLLRV